MLERGRNTRDESARKFAIRDYIKRIPGLRAVAAAIQNGLVSRLRPFRGSASYWEGRYRSGGNSGAGSYNKLAEFKANTLNDFVSKNKISSVIEWGCGDGAQLLMAQYPAYFGCDVSAAALSRCRASFREDPTKSFGLVGEANGRIADLAVSLDVIYHLVEDEVYNQYMSDLFRSAQSFVVIYSSNAEKKFGVQAPHVRHRKFSDWIETNEPDWSLVLKVENSMPYINDWTEGSFADFYFYKKL